MSNEKNNKTSRKIVMSVSINTFITRNKNAIVLGVCVCIIRNISQSKKCVALSMASTTLDYHIFILFQIDIRLVQIV